MPIFRAVDKLTIANDNTIISVKESFKEIALEKVFGFKKNSHGFYVKPKSESESIEFEGVSGNERYKPKPDEIVNIPFRLLSATVVAANTWRATDFSNEKVLKASIPLIEGKPAYTDHFQYADYFIGSINGCTWDPSRPGIPAGINGVYQIDGKMNEKLCRGLLSEPPSIKSNSVTVEFGWETSHEFEQEHEFYNNIGTMVNGEMVRRVVTEIINYHEGSILWMGADPFAKMIDADGKPMQIDKGSVYKDRNKYQKEIYDGKRHFYVSNNFSKNILYLQQENSPNNNDMKSIAELVAEILGLTAGTKVTDAHLKQVSLSIDDKGEIVVAKIDPNAETEISKLKKEIETKDSRIAELSKTGDVSEPVRKLNESLKAEISDLKTANDKLELDARTNAPLIELGKQYDNRKKEQAIELYKKTMAEKADENVVKLIKDAKPEAVDGLLQLHVKGATEKFEGHCAKCNSTEFSFRSTLVGDDGGKGKEQPANEDKNFMKHV